MHVLVALFWIGLIVVAALAVLNLVVYVFFGVIVAVSAGIKALFGRF